MTFLDQVKIKTVKWNLRQILGLGRHKSGYCFTILFIKFLVKYSLNYSKKVVLNYMRWCCQMGLINKRIFRADSGDGVSSSGCMKCMMMVVSRRTCRGLLNNNNIPGTSVFQEWIWILDLPKSNDPGVRRLVSFSLSSDDYSFPDNINEYTWFSYLLHSYA